MHFNCLESERTNDAFPCSRRKSKYLLPDLVVLFDRKITRCVPILMSTRHSPLWRRLWQPGHGYIFAHPISRRSLSSDLGTKNNRRRKALVNLIKIGIMPRCPALFRAFIFNSSIPGFLRHLTQSRQCRRIHGTPPALLATAQTVPG